MPPTFLQRLDGFVNKLTSLGGTRDKRTHTTFEPGRILDPATCEFLFNSNDLAATICQTFPQEAMRQGYDITIGDDEEGTKAGDLKARLDDLGCDAALVEAGTWANVFGNAAVFLGTESGDPASEMGDGERLTHLSVLDRSDLQVRTYYSDPLQPRYAQPETYQLIKNVVPGAGGASMQLIHESRLVFFWGARTTKQARIANNGWHYSALQRPYDVLRDFDIGFSGAAYLLQEASQAVYGVKGLMEILASKQGEELLEKRFRMVEMARSVCNALVIDADGETFERKPTSFTGIPDLLDRFCTRLSAAARIPVTRLVGMSPAGMNATGASDTRMFYDDVKSYQNDQVKPALEKICGMVLRETQEPEQWSIEFDSLYQPTDLETADLRNKQANTDKLYIDAQVVTPEEVAMNRFSVQGWSMETQIDMDLRAELATEDDISSEISAAGGTQVGPEGDIQKTALNGAQVSLIELVQSVAAGLMPRDAALNIIVAAFPVDVAQADKMIGEAGRGFVPKDQESVETDTGGNQSGNPSSGPTTKTQSEKE